MTQPQNETLHQPRLYKRVPPSGQQARLARIVTDAKLPAIDCNVVDYSAGGACLEVPGTPSLPERFDLVYGAVRKTCRVVWSRGLRIGVVF